MAESYRLTGDDTFIINDRPFTDFASGDIISIVADNDISTADMGKNDNIVIAKNAPGKLCTITLRVLKGSSDDMYLHSYYKTYEIDSALFILGSGSFSKRLGDGSGNVIFDTKYLKGLHFSRSAYDSTSNVNGDTNQAVTVYTMRAAIERVVG